MFEETEARLLLCCGDNTVQFHPAAMMVEDYYGDNKGGGWEIEICLLRPLSGSPTIHGLVGLQTHPK
jgi:hypothetical protein